MLLVSLFATLVACSTTATTDATPAPTAEQTMPVSQDQVTGILCQHVADDGSCLDVATIVQPEVDAVSLPDQATQQVQPASASAAVTVTPAVATPDHQ